jgi:hypothetical protein
MKFFYGLEEEIVGVCAGDEVFVREEKSGNTLKTEAVGFVAIIVDEIGEFGIFEGRGDAKRIEASKLGEAMNIARRFDGMSIEPIVIHDQEMEGVAAANRGSVGGGDVGEASVDADGAGAKIEAKLGKDAAGDVRVFAGQRGVTGRWHG